VNGMKPMMMIVMMVMMVRAVCAGGSRLLAIMINGRRSRFGGLCY